VGVLRGVEDGGGKVYGVRGGGKYRGRSDGQRSGGVKNEVGC
jgi:hypothetical protein